MPHHFRHCEKHAINKVGWVRAVVVRPKDDRFSTASLIGGIASASPIGRGRPSDADA
jgi:hypothetical protein